MPDTKFVILIAMVMFTFASIVTTYISLSISVLPEPTVTIPITQDVKWDCAYLALLISVGIGLMLFALKVAIIDEKKRLNVVGLLGMLIVAFISISFNMDVFYRAANRDFYINYTNAQMKKVYADYLAEVESKLSAKKMELLKQVAKQEGELESEIRGIRVDPEGYGPKAKSEDYKLTLLQKETEVELRSIEEAQAMKAKADALLTQSPKDLTEVEALQGELQAAVKDMGAKAGVLLPEPYRAQNQLFVVFAKLFDFRNSDFMEICMSLLIMALALLLDLGDIIGYCMVPDDPEARRARKRREYDSYAGPQVIPAPLTKPLLPESESSPIDYYPEDQKEAFFAHREEDYPLPAAEAEVGGQPPSKRPFHFRRRR
ncbi:MAG TPA: hypothetical protein PKY01_14720 [Candidatus Hydrogenedentes bacterium]|nr:hypothetical protein [Candidatus Hydrogenedentota bacterium]HQH53680.1 hypothetical protein [Candidatus Hydrogenedentota bacterium]HQM50011.1 hypothetical protein [Candidatus Hydrogenedentota bacterium]